MAEVMTMKRIVVEYGVVTQMEREGFGSRPTIWSALRYRSNTGKAQRIRKRALQLGGIEMTQQGKEESVCTK